MKTSDFDYDLPQELIAQEPAAVRDACRMLVMDRETGAIEDRIFRDIIDYLEPGDLLVANETRVLPARLLGAKRGTGGQSEVFLLRQLVGSKAQPYADVPHIPGQPVPGENQQAIWEVLVRPGKRLKPGSGAVVDFTDGEGNVALSAEIVDWAEGAQRGERVARLTTPRLTRRFTRWGIRRCRLTSSTTPAMRNCIKRCIPVAKARRRPLRRACISRPS